jgi:hypothetical protein
MKLFREIPSAVKQPARVWLVITLFALALSGIGAAAFPITIMQNQNNEIAAAKRFVGTWKGKSKPESIAEHVLIFKLEGDRITGTQREFSIRQENGGSPQLVSDQYVALPELTVKGTTLTWKNKMKVLQDQFLDTLHRVTLTGDDEMLVESVGVQVKAGEGKREELVIPLSIKLKKEK